MNETDTTDDQLVDSSDSSSQGGAEESQLDNATDEAAEASTEETQTDLTGTDETVEASAETAEDINLAWLAKTKGVDINDPKAVAEAWRKAEQEFHKGRQSPKSKLKEEAA